MPLIESEYFQGRPLQQVFPPDDGRSQLTVTAPLESSSLGDSPPGVDQFEHWSRDTHDGQTPIVAVRTGTPGPRAGDRPSELSKEHTLLPGGSYTFRGPEARRALYSTLTGGGQAGISITTKQRGVPK